MIHNQFKKEDDYTMNFGKEIAKRDIPLWRISFSAEGWKHLFYSFVVFPVTLFCLLIALIGQSQRGLAYEENVAKKLLTSFFKKSSAQRQTRLQSLIALLVLLPVTFISFLTSLYLAWFVLFSVFYPIRSILRHESLEHILASNYYNAWGGPTLAGAWAVHAVLALIVFLWPAMWFIKLLTWLQSKILLYFVTSNEDMKERR